jgi:glycerol-3-phosphate dehydrogenase
MPGKEIITAMNNSVYDIAIMGGGVVGCAILRRLTLDGLRCVLLEKGADILSGASKGNSALLHTGFDAPTGSLELQCMQAGYREYLDIRERFNLPLVETGAIVVAWNDEEFTKLPGIVAQAHANNVADVHEIAPAELYRLEPHLAPGARGAVRIAGEHVIDPWSAPLAYTLQAIALGAEVRRATQVTGGTRVGNEWKLETSRGSVAARVVVNAAGLYGDRIEAIARESPFSIRPRKGQFVVFDKSAYSLVKAIVLPVPTERTKGVLISRTAFGNLLVGPTAEEVDEREAASVEHDRLEKLIEKAQALVPALAQHSVTAVYAGLRPATQFKDYQIEALADRGWISVGGIRSTGLTGSLGIAAHVADLYARHFGPLRENAQPPWTPVPNLCEEKLRRYEEPNAGEIVCHCERVTKQEIESALSGPLPATDLGGLKRRTRCMMGRCQGFYCSARVMEIAANRLSEPRLDRIKA